MKEYKWKNWHWLVLILGGWLLINFLLGGSLLWKCPILSITGLKCTGCGGQRAVLALFHGNIKEALYFNALIPLLALYTILWVLRKLRFKVFDRIWTTLTGKIAIALLIGTAITFTVLRNTPAWPWY